MGRNAQSIGQLSFVNHTYVSLINTLKGTGVAIVTPFKKNKDIDDAALEKLIEHLIGNHVEYIVTLGTTGETPTLSREEKKQVATFTLDKVNGRVPVVIGIGGNNTKETVDHFQDYPLERFEAILSASPYYNKPSQEGIFQHYKTLAQHSPRPIILYNVPARTGSNISAETTLRLSEIEKIGGIKEASGNMVQCMHILQKRPDDFLFVSGDDHITLPLLGCGADGVISVVANSFSKDFSELVRAGLHNDFAKAQKLQYKLLEAMDLMFAENNPAGVKCFLAAFNLIENELRLPLVPLSEAFNNKVKAYVKQYTS